ncbi:MAG: flagellar protein FlaG [Lachnospiraceae bacterium]|nr:flagellar protein FlaG [Lachnospiraceae bacterium]
MAIEPLGSIMSVQAQTAQKVEPVQPVASTEASVQAEKAPDLKTSIVNEVNKKEEGAANDSRQNQPSNEQIKQAVEKLNKSMPNSEAVFGIHDKTNRVTIKIIDKESKKVIKELPPEKTLDMIAKVWEMAGILVDEKR